MKHISNLKQEQLKITTLQIKEYNTFDQIFHHFPIIYSEILLKLFQDKYFHINPYEPLFVHSLDIIFQNIDKPYTKRFFYNQLKQDFSLYLPIQYPTNLLTDMATFLSTNIDVDILIDIIDNNHISKINLDLNSFYEMDCETKNIACHLTQCYIINKTIAKIYRILKKFHATKKLNYHDYINQIVEKTRTMNLNLSSIYDYYDKKVTPYISKQEFKIIIYFLSIYRNNSYLVKKYKSFLQPINIVTTPSINDYSHGFENNVTHQYQSIALLNLTSIKKSIISHIEQLIASNQDNYHFLVNKDMILKLTIMNYLKTLKSSNKILLSQSYHDIKKEVIILIKHQQNTPIDNPFLPNINTKEKFLKLIELIFESFNFKYQTFQNFTTNNDYLLEKGNQTYILKPYFNNPINLDTIKEITGLINYYHTKKAILILNYKLSPSITIKLKEQNIIPIDRPILNQLTNLIFPCKIKEHI